MFLFFLDFGKNAKHKLFEKLEASGMIPDQLVMLIV